MTAQEEFDSIYITSSEICRRLNVNRTTVVHGHRRGMLPEPIMVNEGQIKIWKRATVEPFLQAWLVNLQSRRGELRA